MKAKIKNKIQTIQENSFQMAGEYFSTGDAFSERCKTFGFSQSGGGCGFGGFDLSFSIIEHKKINQGKLSKAVKQQQLINEATKKDFISSFSLEFNDQSKGCLVSKVYLQTNKYNKDLGGQSYAITANWSLASLGDNDVDTIFKKVMKIIDKKNRLLK